MVFVRVFSLGRTNNDVSRQRTNDPSKKKKGGRKKRFHTTPHHTTRKQCHIVCWHQGQSPETSPVSPPHYLLSHSLEQEELLERNENEGKIIAVLEYIR
jgi:hypothetical protein